MKTKIHSRSIDTEKISIRSDEDTNKRYIEGYAILFNQRSKLIREWGETFYEIIEPGAVDNVLADPGLNVIATVDHDRSKMLGRSKSGTLELIKDARGVKYRILVPDTQLGRDMEEMIQRQDYFESSFIFTITDKGMRYDTSEEIPLRYVSNLSSIRDIAIVIDGAYANTAVSLRSNEWEDETRNSEPGTLNSEPDSYRVGTLNSEQPCSDILQKQIEILRMKF